MFLKLSKSVVYTLLSIIAFIILISTIIFNIDVKQYEVIQFSITRIINIIFMVIAIGAIILIKKISYKLNNKIKILLVITGIIIYIIANIFYINKYKIQPVYDSEHVNNLAIGIANNQIDLYNADYLMIYPNQIGITYFFSGIYKLFNSTEFKVIQYINMVCNLISIGVLYLIFKKLSKKYDGNEILFFTISLTFFPLFLLSTYVYGDYIGLAASIISVYLLMQYTEKNKIIFLILSAILTGFAYFIKSNYLIFFVAAIIYLLLNFIYSIKETVLKQKIIQVICIILFIIISIFPTTLFVKHIQKKYNYENKAFPSSLWIYMGMSESPERTNGWYNGDIAEVISNDLEEGKKEYPEQIKERLNYLISHPVYTLKFYLIKHISMWAEVTYESIWYNLPGPGKQYKELIEDIHDGPYKSFADGNIYNTLVCYGKVLNIAIYTGVIIYILKFRKQLDLNVMYIMIIFLGGFFFHTIWEAKSRYVLPYAVILIPVGIIGISTHINIKKQPKEKNIN